MRLRIRGEYTADWPLIAEHVKRAADYRCIRCHHEHDPVSRHVLTVHHMDGDKSNNAWWNLLALCQRCHLAIQGKVIPERQYMFEHKTWIKPYIGGFYAHYYENLEVTRVEVEADLNRFLAMGQPWLYRAHVA